MNWISENKLFASAVGLLLAAGLTLAVFVLLAAAKFSDISSRYDQATTEMVQLQNLRPHPNQKNLEILHAQKDKLVSSIGALRADLAARVLPVEPITPNEFQDRLRSVVSGVSEAAAASAMALPADFYMGFDPYQDTLPSPAAAPLLNRQLVAMESLVQLLLESRILEISAVDRTPLPEESGGDVSGEPVRFYPIDLTLRLDPGNLRPILNGISTAEHLFMVRDLRITNEKLSGPPRSAAPAAPAPLPGALANLFDPAPEGALPAGGIGRREFIVGTEQIEVFLRVEIIDFSTPGEESDAGDE